MGINVNEDVWLCSPSDGWHLAAREDGVSEENFRHAARAAFQAHIAAKHPELRASWRDRESLERITRQYTAHALESQSLAAQFHGYPFESCWGALIYGPEWLKGDRNWAAVLGA